MKILYHHRTQAEDAQGVHIQAMLRAFRTLGHEVEVVALAESSATGDRKLRGGLWSLPARYAPAWAYDAMSLAYNAVGFARLRECIRRQRPDFIYERYSLNTLCGVWASKRFRIPLILEVNAPLFMEQRDLGRLAFQRLARRSERWVCSNSTRTVVVSQVMKDILAEEGVPREHMVVVPNGVDANEFHPDVSGDPVRRRYGLDGACVVGFVGWFRKWHGLDLLLEALREGGALTGAIRLLLVGDGPAHEDLRRYVERTGLGERVIFTGPIPRDQIPAHIAAMDVAMQPSATEYACPLKLIEYMAMGRCIVAPDQPNVRELVAHGSTAVLFQKGSPAALCRAVIGAARDPVKRRALGDRALEEVRRRGLFWTENAARVITMLDPRGESGNASTVAPPHWRTRHRQVPNRDSGCLRTTS